MKIKEFINFIKDYTEKVLLKKAEPNVYISTRAMRESSADFWLNGKTWQSHDEDECLERGTSAFARYDKNIAPEKGVYDYRTRCKQVFETIAEMSSEKEYNGYEPFDNKELILLIFDFDFLWMLCEEYLKRGINYDEEFASFASIIMSERYDYVMERAPELASESIEKKEDMPIYTTVSKAMISLELSFYDENDIREAVDAFINMKRNGLIC